MYWYFTRWEQQKLTFRMVDALRTDGRRPFDGFTSAGGGAAGEFLTRLTACMSTKQQQHVADGVWSCKTSDVFA